MKTDNSDIRTVLSNGFYLIPRFQRPYSWDAENVQEFWDDIIRDGVDGYFIGSIVLYRMRAGHYGVVDGQQRLTTLTLLLCAIRNRMRANGSPDLADGIQGMIERPDINNQIQYVLQTETSHPYFQSRIQSNEPESTPATMLAEEQALQKAFDLLDELVAAAIKSIEQNPSNTEKKKKMAIKKELVKFRDRLLSLVVITITLPNSDDAYLIFETLNTRGKDLRLTDLVKNQMTRLVKSKNVTLDTMKSKWASMVEITTGSSAPISTDEYLHHFWLSRDEYLPAKKVFKVLKTKVRSVGEAQSFMDQLVDDAALYRTIFEPSYRKWLPEEKSVEEALTALRIFGVKQPVPCVLSLLREYHTTKKIKLKHLLRAICAIEKFHFVFTAVTSQRSSGGISQMYAAAGRRLFEAHDVITANGIIRALVEKLDEKTPHIGEFIALFRDITFTDQHTKRKRLVKYTLANFHRRTSPHSATDYSQMTIEHLIPQSEIGSDADAEVIGMLGNLILVPTKLNQELANKSFKKKQAILLKHGVPLPETVASAAIWDFNAVMDHTDELADIAYKKIWRIG